MKVHNLPLNYTIPFHSQYFDDRHYDDGDNLKDMSRWFDENEKGTSLRLIGFLEGKISS